MAAPATAAARTHPPTVPQNHPQTAAAAPGERHHPSTRLPPASSPSSSLAYCTFRVYGGAVVCCLTRAQRGRSASGCGAERVEPGLRRAPTVGQREQQSTIPTQDCSYRPEGAAPPRALDRLYVGPTERHDRRHQDACSAGPSRSCSKRRDCPLARTNRRRRHRWRRSWSGTASSTVAPGSRRLLLWRPLRTGRPPGAAVTVYRYAHIGAPAGRTRAVAGEHLVCRGQPVVVGRLYRVRRVNLIERSEINAEERSGLPRAHRSSARTRAALHCRRQRTDVRAPAERPLSRTPPSTDPDALPGTRRYNCSSRNAVISARIPRRARTKLGRGACVHRRGRR